MNTDLLYTDLSARARAWSRYASWAVGITAVIVFVWIAVALTRSGAIAGPKWSIFLTIEGWSFIGGGLVNTLKVAVVDAVIALTMGAAMALAMRSRLRLIRAVGVLYAETFRLLPTLLLVLFLYFGMSRFGVSFSPYWALVLGSALYNSAIFAALFYAAIQSVPQGQTEAGLSLGFSKRATTVLFVMPQALRYVVPSLVAQLVVLLKDSSLGFFIGYDELLNRAQQAGSFNHSFLPTYIVAAAIYCLVCFGLSRVAKALANRVAAELPEGV